MDAYIDQARRDQGARATANRSSCDIGLPPALQALTTLCTSPASPASPASPRPPLHGSITLLDPYDEYTMRAQPYRLEVELRKSLLMFRGMNERWGKLCGEGRHDLHVARAGLSAQPTAWAPRSQVPLMVRVGCCLNGQTWRCHGCRRAHLLSDGKIGAAASLLVSSSFLRLVLRGDTRLSEVQGCNRLHESRIRPGIPPRQSTPSVEPVLHRVWMQGEIASSFGD